METSKIRREYRTKKLSAKNFSKDPYQQFARWFKDALKNSITPDPTAMTLATTSLRGRVSARMVLLKDFNSKGFRFFTNYKSHKSKQIFENPYAALVFYWPDLHRQIRIEGEVHALPDKESDAYFKSRPVGSQIAAHLSPQSSRIPVNANLEEALAVLVKQFGDTPIPRPKDWGGFRLVPHHIEFWQGQPNRLHDRFVYELIKKKWDFYRVAP